MKYAKLIVAFLLGYASSALALLIWAGMKRYEDLHAVGWVEVDPFDR